MRDSIVVLLGTMVLTLALSGCGKKKAHPAASAYDALVMAMLSGKAEAFVDLLSPSSRTVLAQRLGLPEQASSATLAGSLGFRSHWRFESDLLKKTKVVEGEGDSSLRWVSTEVAGEAWRIPVEQDGERWRVDLFNGRADGVGSSP